MGGSAEEFFENIYINN